MSSATRKALPPNSRAQCTRCGAGIPYHGRRDLLQLVAAWRRELEQGFGSSSSRLADVSCGIMQSARAVEASAAGLCVSCVDVREPPAPTRQLELVP